MIRLPAARDFIFAIAKSPTGASAFRYSLVLGVCLIVFAGSGSFLASTAKAYLTDQAKSPAYKRVSAVEISVPNTPIVLAPAPSPVANSRLPSPLNSPTLGTQVSDVSEVSALPATASTPVNLLYAMSAVNVRAEPGNASVKVARLSAGQAVQALENRNGWIQIAVSSVVLGWAYGKYLSPEPTAFEASADATLKPRRPLVVLAEAPTLLPKTTAPPTSLTQN